jgi:hypothetical protein
MTFKINEATIDKKEIITKKLSLEIFIFTPQ